MPSSRPAALHDDEGWTHLVEASERLASSRTLSAVVEVLRGSARDVAGAQGIAVVIREDDRCFYAAEDAIGPLWAGNRFPLQTCVSGWAMTRRETVLIPDIRLDDRVPQAAYAATFVRSLVMVPIGAPDAVAAIGAYWSDVRDHDPDAIRRLEALARAAAIALENAKLLETVRESDRQRSIAVEAGRMGVWSLDIASGELETSAAFRSAFGRDPTADFPYQALRDAIHPDDRARVFAATDDSLATGCEYDVEYRLTTPQGEERWVEIRAKPSHHVDGTPLSLSGVSIDITASKQLQHERDQFAKVLERRVEERTQELIETQEALRQSQKLEAMGQLTGGVAHDFNNLLTPILGSLDLLTRRKTGDEREQRMIAGALHSAERAKTLVQRLLAFARRQPLQAEGVDVPALLVEMRPLLGTTLGPQIELLLDMPADLPLAHSDRNQLEMAVLNISVNARDAMAGIGRLTITAEMRTGAVELTPGEYVVLSVADTGAGMDEATRQRAIEPFFSTKGIGKGTGLGLSMVHGLVAQLGGTLVINSELGAGTSVEMWLPVSTVQSRSAEVRGEPRTELPRGDVLLVDDEVLVRASTADMLVEFGLRVFEAGSGVEALTILEREPSIGLVVTDHLMPGMNGADLATRIRATRPGLPVLIVSGYADIAGIPTDVPRLAKPFRQADLADGIASAVKKGSQMVGTIAA